MTTDQPRNPSAETLGDLIAGDPQRVALIAPNSGQSLTYADLNTATEELAGTISGLGIARGDRVAVVVGHGPQLVLLLLALARIGATAMPLNHAYTEQEYTFYLSDLAPSLLLVAEGLQVVKRAAPSLHSVTVLGVSDDRLVPRLSSDGGEADAASRSELARPDDTLLLLHTSGTTSRPKQVPLAHSNVAASAQTIVSHYKLTEADVSYCVMPLFHVHGLVASAFACFASGGTVVVPGRFSPRAFWTHLRDFGITWFSASPTLHQMILERRAAHKAPGTLRFLRSCSSPLSEYLMETAEDVYGVPMLEAYGMTEASHQISSNPLPPGRRVPGSVGIPTGTRLRIVDADGHDLADGARGEVVVSGPGLTSGYLDNPEAVKDSFTDGWFRTGDIGRLNDGYLTLEGRLKEMVIRGGENVSPYEIEAALQLHPAVRHAACFGLPDEKYGERVFAAVEIAFPATERDLLRHCRARLAAFKVPERIYVLDSLPRTPTGKIQRRKVAAAIAEGKP